MTDRPLPAAYRIETDRLLLRCHEPADAPAFKARIDADLDYLAPWLPWARVGPRPVAEHAARMRRVRAQFDLDQDFAYAVLDRTANEVLGGSGLHTRGPAHQREIGYWIRSDRAGQGYATELSAALVRVGFEVCGLERIQIMCDPENAASARVAEKLGFSSEGVLRGGLELEPGVLRDNQLFALVRSDYAGSPAAAFAVQAFDALGEPLL